MPLKRCLKALKGLAKAFKKPFQRPLKGPFKPFKGLAKDF
jgi:hypothetical protein